MFDDALHTHRGLSWADFVLVTVLGIASGAAPATQLACICERRLGTCYWDAAIGKDRACEMSPIPILFIFVMAVNT